MRTLFADGGSARVHAIATVLVVLAGFVLHISRTDWALIALAVAAVWSAEGFNTAIEQMVNLLSPELRHLAGRIKDMAAGAVLIAAIGAAAVGLLVFVPPVWRLLLAYL